MLELLAPPACAACGSGIEAREDGFCPGCAVLIDEFPCAPDSDDRAACVYGGPIADAIARLKYRGHTQHARMLAGLLVATAEPWVDRVDRVCVVPLHRGRLTERGYNQSALLARPVAWALGARFDPGLLVRAKATGTQVGADPGVRRKQLRGAFRAAARARGLRILVVDDVRTTGASLAEARRALNAVGAQRVYTLALGASAADQG